MPLIPEAIMAMLATVRLGAIHSVVFGGLYYLLYYRCPYNRFSNLCKVLPLVSYAPVLNMLNQRLLLRQIVE